MRGARPERALEQTIERSDALRRRERVLIACSGGPDSAALLVASNAVAQRTGLVLYAAHVNHGTRPSAWQDECIVLELAGRCAIPLDVVTLEGRRHDEAGLRAERYRALAEIARRRECGAIATAHHAEDQSETVLLALLRGAGPSGLGGMASRRVLQPGLDLARPLLGVGSEALRAYCHAQALPYAVDPTNAESGLRRNAVREALAALRPLFPALDEAVARAAELVAAERDRTRRADLRRSIREQLAGDEGLRDIDFAHVEAAVRALEGGATGTFHMKAGVALKIERGVISGVSRE